MPILGNPHHERFCQEIAQGRMQDEAYELAGYSKNRGNASRLRSDPKIAARIQEILEAGAERAEITRERVLAELGRIGFNDIRKVFSENGALKRVEELDDDAAAAVAAIEVVTRRVPGGDADEVEHVAKIKTWDKRAALVDIAKMQGWLVDRHEHTGKDGGPIETADVSENEAARRVAFLLLRADRQPTQH